MNNTLFTIIGIVGGSTLLAAIATNWQGTRQHKKELIAGATKSALMRVELYYRLKRRLSNGGDDTAIRDQLHEVQEENDYYKALLDIEAPWLGESYRCFLIALKRKLEPFMHEAWEADGMGPSAQIPATQRPDTDKYVRIFTKDSRRLFNPLMRPLMRARYTLRKFFKDDKYGS